MNNEHRLDHTQTSYPFDAPIPSTNISKKLQILLLQPYTTTPHLTGKHFFKSQNQQRTTSLTTRTNQLTPIIGWLITHIEKKTTKLITNIARGEGKGETESQWLGGMDRKGMPWKQNQLTTGGRGFDRRLEQGVGKGCNWTKRTWEGKGEGKPNKLTELGEGKNKNKGRGRRGPKKEQGSGKGYLTDTTREGGGGRLASATTWGFVSNDSPETCEQKDHWKLQQQQKNQQYGLGTTWGARCGSRGGRTL